MYYPYSENKGADQLRDHPEADLRLCFRICKKTVFSRRGSYKINKVEVIYILPKQGTTKVLVRLTYISGAHIGLKIRAGKGGGAL